MAFKRGRSAKRFSFSQVIGNSEQALKACGTKGVFYRMKPAIYVHKVQYYETDRMDCVHHSNYIRWFEEARCFLMEERGFGYDRMEALGILSPVLACEAQYRSMTRFGETVEIEAGIEHYTGVKIAFSYTVRDRETGKVRCTGRTEHCFLGQNGRPAALKKLCPQLDALVRAALDETGA